MPGVTFLLANSDRDEPDQTKKTTSSVTFIFRKGSTDKFTQDDWQRFFQFYREILPSVFQGKRFNLSISRHPAIFTDKKLLFQIAEETDYEIPARYLVKTEE